jgi:hypothetical protein
MSTLNSNFGFSQKDVRNLCNLHDIAKRGTKAEGIFFDTNRIPLKVTMERVRKSRSLFYETKVTIGPLNKKDTIPCTSIIFNKGKNVDQIQSAIGSIGKKIWNNMTPLERSNAYQNRAEELIKKGDATNAFPLLNAAEREQNTPAGREAWQALGDEKQANWHEKMADLCTHLNQLGNRVGPQHRQQNDAKIRHHTTQAEWAQRGPNRRSQDCQALAQQLLGK